MSYRFLKNKKIIVAMSGGVDSSVAAYLLKQEGLDIEGLFMKNWERDGLDLDECPSYRDMQDAQSVCDGLGIKLHLVNFAAEYWDNVFENFLEEYSKGRTPNPDILCNKEIKFKVFLQYATEVLNADYIATGHYANIQLDSGRYNLQRGVDKSKDQSYFLYALNQFQLSKTIFPIGGYQKTQIRALASELNLVTATKKDSTGICFIGEKRFNDFLSNYIPAKSGLIKSTEGQVLGEHSGLMFYTLGQRKGVGIGGLQNSSGDPWYVVKKDIKNNVLIVGQGSNNPLLFSDGCVLEGIHFINSKPLDTNDLTAKVRYRQDDVPCSLSFDQGQPRVIFKAPLKAVTEGQSLVLYYNDVCVGGGVINSSFSI